MVAQLNMKFDGYTIDNHNNEKRYSINLRSGNISIFVGIKCRKIKSRKEFDREVGKVMFKNKSKEKVDCESLGEMEK